MFIGVQKLELSSGRKSPELRQFFDLGELQPLGYSGFARRNGFDTDFLVKLSFGRRLARFKSFNFDAFGNISRLIV